MTRSVTGRGVKRPWREQKSPCQMHDGSRTFKPRQRRRGSWALFDTLWSWLTVAEADRRWFLRGRLALSGPAATVHPCGQALSRRGFTRFRALSVSPVQLGASLPPTVCSYYLKIDTVSTYVVPIGGFIARADDAATGPQHRTQYAHMFSTHVVRLADSARRCS